MKKVIAIISILFLLMGCTSVYAANQVTEMAQSTTGKIIEIKDRELKTLEEYKEAYGSDAYGLTAFLLSKIRVYSIPFGFVAIIIAAIYQYIIGIKKIRCKRQRFCFNDCKCYNSCNMPSITTSFCNSSKRLEGLN